MIHIGGYAEVKRAVADELSAKIRPSLWGRNQILAGYMIKQKHFPASFIVANMPEPHQTFLFSWARS